jgi:hypothetical protein
MNARQMSGVFIFSTLKMVWKQNNMNIVAYIEFCCEEIMY